MGGTETLKTVEDGLAELPLIDVHTHLVATAPLRKTGTDGVFVRYGASVEARKIQVGVEKVRDAAPSSPVKMGKAYDWRGGPVAMVPDDPDFAEAGVWRLTLPKDVIEQRSDVFLDVSYVGDVGRLYDGTNLLDDNFFNETPWEIGLKRFAPEALAKGLHLQILPLRKDAPIYMPKTAWPEFDGKSQVAEVKSVVASPEYEVTLSFPRQQASH